MSSDARPGLAFQFVTAISATAWQRLSVISSRQTQSLILWFRLRIASNQLLASTLPQPKECTWRGMGARGMIAPTAAGLISERNVVFVMASPKSVHLPADQTAAKLRFLDLESTAC
jgi:hypothetical protein